MSVYSIEVCPTSKVIVFQGSLKKAPNLNRRGRKKWKERFFILRANKMLECYKSRKAATPRKSPRKVIDLRSCIALEVGLEYRELQHILSLGTFKKTFFFAAHSDALMLQWGDNIEKVKNALDGEIIEVLDISLRRSPHRTPRHTTPPDDSRSLYQYGTSHSSSAIAQLSTPMHEHVSGRSPSLPPQPPPFSPTAIDPPSPEFDQDDLKHQRQRSKSHDGTRKTRVYVNVSPRPPSSSPKYLSSSLTRDTRATEDTHQLATQRTKRGGMVEGGDYDSSSLPRPLGKIPPPRIASKIRKDSTSSEDNSPISSLMTQERVESIQASGKTAPKGASLRSGMTRSFRYRKIALRKEKPTVRPIPEYDSSDDEDEETESEYDSGPLSSKRSLAKSSPNLTSAGRRAGRHVRNGNRPAPLPPNQHEMYQPTSYSKVTVVGVKVSTVPSPHVKHSCRKDKDSDHDENHSRRSDTFPLPPPSPNDAVFAEFEKHCSGTTLLQETGSTNSLDKILEPPTMFEDPGDQLHPLPAVDSRDQNKVQAANEEGNRSSTESFDTGYNSSPGYTNKPTAIKDSSSIGEGQRSKVNERLCVPMVFFCPKVGRNRGVIGLQVCLVEQNADLMQKVVLVKEVEGYSVIECEQESGRTPAVSRPDGDSLTVETSLEDIEFGFSVVNTVQKDTFERKVREFQFELRDLFNSSSKPFSCEVHIRHADEVTVLPVEVERA